jgi:hypothetical protein
MSLAENLLPSRNGSRHKKGDMTRVQSALSEPLPGGIDQAVAKVKAAIEAFDVARSAFAEIGSAEAKAELEQAVMRAEFSLSDATVKREVADRIGGDGPSDAEIEALETAFSRAKTARDSVDTRKAAYSGVVEARRKSLSDAQHELWAIVDAWVDAAYAAADRQLAEGVNLIGEALHMAKALTTWQSQWIDADVRHHSLVAGTGEIHRGPDNVELPPEIANAVLAWRQADSAGRH